MGLVLKYQLSIAISTGCRHPSLRFGKFSNPLPCFQQLPRFVSQKNSCGCSLARSPVRCADFGIRGPRSQGPGAEAGNRPLRMINSCSASIAIPLCPDRLLPTLVAYHIGPVLSSPARPGDRGGRVDPEGLKGREGSNSGCYRICTARCKLPSQAAREALPRWWTDADHQAHPRPLPFLLLQL